MVYQRAVRRERCIGCGFGKGQFQVQYDDECDGSGRGYCSLDCYTSAKVTGRNLQTQARGRGGDGMPYNQQHRRGPGGGGGPRGYYGGGVSQPPPQRQPWPTGLLVDAPPSPKPWRGRTLSQDSTSWRTVSTGNLSVGDESSSQESWVADWHGGGESEDGDASVGSGNGSAGDVVDGGVGAGNVNVGLPAQGPHAAAVDNLGNRRFDSGDSSGGGAAAHNGGSGGGAVAARAGGNFRDEEAGRHDLDGNSEINGDGSVGGGGRGGGGGGRAPRVDAATTHRPPLAPIPLVPVAPIPRLRAFPAQRRVHGAYGGGADGYSGGGRRVPVRTVAFAAPPAQASPPPRPPGGQGAVVGREAVTLRPLPAEAATGPPPQQQTAMLAVSVGVGVGMVGGAALPLGLILEEDGCCSPGGKSGAGGDDVGKVSAEAAYGDGDGGCGAPRPPGTGDKERGGLVDAPPPTPTTSGGSGCAAVTWGGGDPETSTAGTGTGIGVGAGMTKGSSGGGNSGGLSACGAAPARRASSAVSTKVAVRQWRRLFLP